jgi:hypothetical protein
MMPLVPTQYPAYVGKENEPVRASPAVVSPARSRRAPVLFAILGVALAVVAIGLYALRPTTSATTGTPEDAVQEFLAAVFLAHDTGRLAKVTCAGWDASDAMTRTLRQIDKDARVSWDDISVVSSDGKHVNVRVRLGLRLPDDKQPTSFQQWRFSVVDENDWRVCEARPFVP